MTNNDNIHLTGNLHIDLLDKIKILKINYLIYATLSRLGTGNLIFCCTSSQDNYSGWAVGQNNNNNNNPKF